MFILLLFLLLLLEVFALISLITIFFFLLKFLSIWLEINKYLNNLEEVMGRQGYVNSHSLTKPPLLKRR